MIILKSVPDRPVSWKRPVAAIGIFDGVHRGHQAILRRAVSRARAIGGTPAALTFSPHPASVLAPGAVPSLILSLPQRLEAFRRNGIRAALVIPFTRSFSRWPAEKFVKELLVRRLKVKEVVVGHDFGFGAGRRGTIETLRSAGKRFGFRVHVMPPVRLGNKRISSRGIREMIRAGKLAQAAQFLSRPVAITGEVVRGRGRGKALGFATANIQVHSGVLPPAGVYAVAGRVAGGGMLRGMANLGYQPTFGEKGAAPLLEAHFFGVRRELYGRPVELEFISRIRAGKRFDSPDQLAAQLKKDAFKVRGLVSKRYT